MIDGRIYVLDADMNLKACWRPVFAGMLLAVPPVGRSVPATFYERGTRGKRTDVIQIFRRPDPTVVGDEIPMKRRPAPRL